MIGLGANGWCVFLALAAGMLPPNVASQDTLALERMVTDQPGDHAIVERPPPLVITAEELHTDRFIARDLVLPIPGIDLVQTARPRYIRADRMAFAARHLDDTAWPVMDSAGDAGFEPGSIYWVRFEMILLRATPSDGLDDGLELSIFSQAAMEVYLNGKSVEHYGSLPAAGSERDHRAAPFMPHRSLRLRFARDGLPETIALRYRYEPIKDRDTGQLELLKVALQFPADAQRMERIESATLLQFGVFLGVNLIIMLLALVILALRPKDASWRRMAFFSFFMVLVAFSNTVPKISANVSLAFMEWVKYLNFIAYPFALLFLVLVVRSLFTTITWRSVLFFTVLTLILVGSSFLTYHAPDRNGRFDGWLMLIFLFEVAWQSVRAVRTRVQGAWIVGVGAMLFIFNGVLLEQLYQFLELTMPQAVRTYIRFSLYLTMPITITVYLAVRSANLTRMLARQRDDLDVEVMDRTADLNFEKERSETLLRNILPDVVVQELKDKGKALAREYVGATILFSDFKEFTRISQTMSPQALVEELDTCFKEFDRIISDKGIEKIKTIGDAYMCVGGLPDPLSTTAADVVRAGLEMQVFITERKAQREQLGLTAFEMRVGLHSGSVVAGIVGVKKFAYDIWGDAVNTACAMERSGVPGKVNISAATYERVRRESDLAFTPRGKVLAKGKGKVDMYFVENAAGHIGKVAT